MIAITIPKVMVFSGGMKLLDMMPMGYDIEYVKSLFETLGEKGRDVYLSRQIPVDMIYPFLFGISYSLLIAFFLKKIDKLNSVLFFLCWLPVIAGIADYLENFGTILMLNSYPNIASNSVILTNLFTLIKSMITTLYFIALITVMIAAGVKYIKVTKIKGH